MQENKKTEEMYTRRNAKNTFLHVLRPEVDWQS